LTGQIDGTATVTGELANPRVDANVSVGGGSVNGVPFERLAGTVQYSDRQLGLDMALEAGRLAGSRPKARCRGDGDRRPPAAAVRLRIESSAINLALFQPLVTHAEKLAGTGRSIWRCVVPRAQAESSARLDRRRELHAGRHRSDLSALDAKVTANGDELSVDQFGLHDGDGHVATIAGT
jgi:hypothetical protein